jgi:anti-sigma factor RsiW
VRSQHPLGEPDLNAVAAYAEGRLAPAERLSVEGHLASCAECRGTAALYVRAQGGEGGRRGVSPALRWLAAAAGLLLATVVGLRVAWLNQSSAPLKASPTPPAPAGSAARPVLPEPPPAPREGQPPARPADRPPSEPIDESLLAKRGAAKRVAGKTFRLVVGEWRDSELDPVSELPVVEIRTAEERDALLARLPALTPYAGIGDRVTVVLDGTVYRFLPTSLPSAR